jgi:putative endonuclease
MRKYFVYILASHRNGALSCGVTSNLVHKTWQHRAGQIAGAPAGSMLVWFEEHLDMRSTLRRQQQIARATRDWQLRLIEQANPGWRDLYETLLPGPASISEREHRQEPAEA